MGPRRDLGMGHPGKIINMKIFFIIINKFRSGRQTYRNLHDDKQMTEGYQGELDYNDVGYDPSRPGGEHVNVHSLR